MKMPLKLAFLVLFILGPTASLAEEASVEGVTVRKNIDGTYYFEVTVRHSDTGWDHYVNRWEVVGPDGTIYGERVLLHPHENEQPFTRSQNGIPVPESVKSVTVRAHDSVHQFGGVEVPTEIPE